jgi:hypothetical protein
MALHWNGAKSGSSGGAPKPGSGRPPGAKNRRPAPSYDVGKTPKRELTLKQNGKGRVKRQA